MPTFDFYNIIRGFLRIILFSVRNPILMLGTLALSASLVVANVTSFFGFGEFVDFWICGQLDNFQQNGFVAVLFYILNIDAFLNVVRFVFSWGSRVVVFVSVFYAMWWAECLIYTGGATLRKTIKDIAS